MFTIDLNLNNQALYAGCEIGEVGGRLTLLTLPVDAANIIGRNVTKVVDGADDDHTVVKLTGPMAVWAYLVVFHAVVHRFGEVWYDDGRGNSVLVAKH